MEFYITIIDDITYKCELIPTNALKLWNRILARFMSRDTLDNILPLV